MRAEHMQVCYAARNESSACHSTNGRFGRDFLSACRTAAPTAALPPTSQANVAPSATNTRLPASTQTPAPTHTPKPSATATSTSTNTPRPTVTATPTPTHPLMIELNRLQEYPGSLLTVEQTLEPGSNYDRTVVSYQSEGNKIYALLTEPWGDPHPAAGR